MAPNSEKVLDNLPLTSGFTKYPTDRDIFFKSADSWINGKKVDDGVYPYWRIHNKLYDLKDFIHRHPGGKFLLEVTQGTDITELFEISHFGPNPDQVMKKYFVKEISTPRNSPYTFKENGFYKTLKKKVTPIVLKEGKGPLLKSVVLQDTLLFSFLFFLVMGTIQNSIPFILVSSFILAMGMCSAHNFLHQGDNWRMYLFDFMLMPSRDFRITHTLSHHPFSNTIYDYEISVLEPFFDVLPRRSKSYLVRFGAFFTGFFFFSFGLYIDLAKKIILASRKEFTFHWENFIVFGELVLMALFGESVSRGIWLWFVFQSATNLIFFFHGVTVSHHHPDIYREGDVYTHDKDWGMAQLLSTRQRGELLNPFLFAAVTFGNHTLHHLFPTVDHSRLPQFQDAFLKTCKEFNISFEPYSFWELLTGFYWLNTNTKPNTPRFQKKKESVQ